MYILFCVFLKKSLLTSMLFCVYACNIDIGPKCDDYYWWRCWDAFCVQQFFSQEKDSDTVTDRSHTWKKNMDGENEGLSDVKNMMMMMLTTKQKVMMMIMLRCVCLHKMLRLLELEMRIYLTHARTHLLTWLHISWHPRMIFLSLCLCV